MKRLGLFPGFLAATQFLAIGLHAGDEAKTAAPAPGPAPAAVKSIPVEDLFKPFDPNHANPTSPPSTKTVSWEMLVRTFDLNGDGKIDEAELTNFETVLRQQTGANPARVKAADKNGDGKLDDAEWASVWEPIKRSVKIRSQMEEIMRTRPDIRRQWDAAMRLRMENSGQSEPQTLQQKLDQISARAERARAERIERERLAQEAAAAKSPP